MGTEDALAAPLKQYFGHDRLRPIQDQAVADVLAGRDVFVVMPTGGVSRRLCRADKHSHRSDCHNQVSHVFSFCG